MLRATDPAGVVETPIGLPRMRHHVDRGGPVDRGPEAPADRPGTPLVDDPNRIGVVTAIGLDEAPFVRDGRFRPKRCSTSIVNVHTSRLLDVVRAAAGRVSSGPARRGTASRQRDRSGAAAPAVGCSARSSTR